MGRGPAYAGLRHAEDPGDSGAPPRPQGAARSDGGAVSGAAAAQGRTAIPPLARIEGQERRYHSGGTPRPQTSTRVGESGRLADGQACKCRACLGGLRAEREGLTCVRACSARAAVRAAHQQDDGVTGSHPSRERSVRTRAVDPVVQGWVDWLLPKGPRVFGTINTRYPLSVAQHERAGYALRRMFYDACGESPTVMVACQGNPSRDGYHSHPLILGSPQLLTARRTEIWRELTAELELQRGGGQVWTPAGGGFDNRAGGGAFYSRPVAEADARNGVRVRLEPVNSREDVLGYATRYGVREGDALYVITGDQWGMEWEIG